MTHLRHNAGRTAGRLKNGPIQTLSGAVESVGLDVPQVPGDWLKHVAALVAPVTLHRDGQVLLLLLRQVPSLQDPAGVAMVREAQAREHLANHVKGHEEAGDAQDGHQPLLEEAELADLLQDLAEGAHGRCLVAWCGGGGGETGGQDEPPAAGESHTRSRQT